jgi:FkbM family methyltransferase
MSLQSVPRLIKRIIPARLKRALKAAVDPDASQHGEATLLAGLVNEFECQQFLVDVGANDGVTISNSLSFVRAGWQGILIEPAPAVFKKLQQNHGRRENVTCLQISCSDKPGVADLYIGSDGEEGFLATLCQTDNEWFKQARGSQTVEVRTDTLTNILRDQEAPSSLGVLLVDCEGLDYEVFVGLDFSLFRPTIIATEEYEWEPLKHAAKYALLIQNNYSLVQKVGCNTVWIDRSARRRS